MENVIEKYYKINITYLTNYLKNNPDIDENNYTFEELYNCLENDVDILLSLVKISSNQIGYMYWKDAIILFYLNDKKRIKMKKDIYDPISTKYEKSSSSIDRSMRLSFENSLYKIKSDEDNFVLKYFRDSLKSTHNCEIIYKFLEIISSKAFQNYKKKNLHLI